MVGHGGSSVGSYLADPTSPIPSHCASIVVTSTLRVKSKRKWPIISKLIKLCDELSHCYFPPISSWNGQIYLIFESHQTKLKHFFFFFFLNQITCLPRKKRSDTISGNSFRLILAWAALTSDVTALLLITAQHKEVSRSAHRHKFFLSLSL